MLKILLSFIISYISWTILWYYSLSERFLIKIRKEDNYNRVNNMGQTVKRCLIIKYIIFYVVCFTLLTLFWFFSSSFCAIFQNTQIYVIINTFISFGISILYPFIYNLIPCIFRIYSLKNNKECVYKFSNIIQLI